MKLCTSVLVVLLVLHATVVMSERDYRAEWRKWCDEHKPSYLDNKLEHEKRYALWLDNLHFVERHNARYEAGEVSYYLGQNRMSDREQAEISAMTSGVINANQSYVDAPYLEVSEENLQNVPEEIDWVKMGAVNKVKDQQPCGTCWIFASVAAVESAYYLHRGKLLNLSEQEVLDCINKQVACHSGGVLTWGYEYMSRVGNSLNVKYPYQGVRSKCKRVGRAMGPISGYKLLPHFNEKSLKSALYQFGPVGINVDAHEPQFSFYKGGIYSSPHCRGGFRDLTHAMTAVGYGIDQNNKEFWLIRNSWSTTWGEKGYMRMARNQGNMCGVATLGSVPVI